MSATDPIFELVREAMLTALFTALPVLGAALLATLLTVLLQRVTRMSDTMLSVVPRIVAGIITLIAVGPWLGHRIASFAERIWSLIQTVHT